MALQVWLPLNGNINNQGLRGDIIPQMMGNGVTFVDGKTGKAANFPNNPDSCLYMTGMELQTGTWCAWIKVLGEGSGASQRIISEGRDYSRIGTNFYVNKAGTTLFFQSHKQALSRSIPLNTWTHIAGTFGDGKIVLYINGNKVSSIAYTEDTDYYYSNGELVLGKMSYSRSTTTNYFPFNGQICDFRVYDNVLSENEIYEIAKALILHYPLSREGFGSDNLLKSTNEGVGLWAWSANGGSRPCEAYDTIGVKMTTATAANSGSWSVIRYDDTNLKNILQPNTEYTLSFDACFPNSGTVQCSIRNMNGLEPLTNAQNITVVANKWKHYSCKLTTVNTITISSQIIYLAVANVAPATTAGISVYFKNIKFELGAVATQWIPNSQDALYIAMGLDNNTVSDVSGYKHNANMMNQNLFDYLATTHKYNVGLLFKRKSTTNASTEIGYLQCNNFYMPDEFTISYWWYYDSSMKLVANPPSCFGYGTSDGQNRNGIHHYDDKICINIAPFGSEQNIDRKVVSGVTYREKVWQHYCITFDGITLTVYVNGVVKGSITTGQSEKYHIIRSDGNLFIGMDRAGGVTRGASGCLQDFRIYATTLSPDDILKLYNTPITLNNNGTLLTSGEFVEVY